MGATCRWKALWAVRPHLFDERGGRAVLGTSRETLDKTGAYAGATESARGSTPASHVVDNAAATWRSPKSGRPRLFPSVMTGQAQWSIGPKLGLRRQARSTWGWIAARWSGAERRVGLTPERGDGRRGESHALGSQAIHGCSCRESVADVGEEHLLRAIEESREANQEDAK